MNNKIKNRAQIVENEVEKTLALFDEKAEPHVNPYFYTKLMASIESRGDEKNGYDFLDKFKLAYILPALCALLLIFNIVTIALKSSEAAATTNNNERAQLIKSFQEEYSLPVDNIMFDEDGK